MEKALRIVMAGGGTGGHLYPGLAVAEALERQAAGGNLEILWAATPRAVDQRLLSGFGERYIQQAVKPLMMSVGKLWGFWRGWRETCNYWGRYFAKNKVDCVVALGGYAAGPAGHVAAKRGIPVVLLNPDALPGRANRFLLKRADIVVTQWAFIGAGEALAKRVRILGCPVRRELVGRRREEGAARLGIDAARKTLVVTGASLGAKTINDAVVALLGDAEVRGAFEDDAAFGDDAATRRRGDAANDGGGESANEPDAAAEIKNQKSTIKNRPGWQVVHLAGMEQAAEVRAAYAQYPQVRGKVMDYCDDMGSVWAVADLAIARAGASTCAELTACGVPSILLPYPFHRDMHQRANAMELAKGGAAVIVHDAKEAKTNAAAIKTELKSLLYDESRRVAMAEAAKRMGKPDAAERIADEILALIARSLR